MYEIHLSHLLTCRFCFRGPWAANKMCIFYRLPSDTWSWATYWVSRPYGVYMGKKGVLCSLRNPGDNPRGQLWATESNCQVSTVSLIDFVQVADLLVPENNVWSLPKAFEFLPPTCFQSLLSFFRKVAIKEVNAGERKPMLVVPYPLEICYVWSVGPLLTLNSFLLAYISKNSRECRSL